MGRANGERIMNIRPWRSPSATSRATRPIRRRRTSRAAVGPELYGEWLGQLAARRRLSLYIHVPFCTELCLYCGCHTKAVRKREPVDNYAARLVEEIDLLDGDRRPQAHPSALGRRHALDPRPDWLETIAAKLASPLRPVAA